jgi:valyl-tRNA synthetase
MNKAELNSGLRDEEMRTLSLEHLDLADRWILSRLNHAVGDFNAALGEFHLNESSKILYDFIWHDFCDWYVELAKTRFYSDEEIEVKRAVLERALWIFDRALRMLHPMMPFVTEELWQHLAERKGRSIMQASFPTVDERWIDQKAEDDMAFIQNLINAVRNIRGENNISPSKEIVVKVRFGDGASGAIFDTYGKYLKKLARVSDIESLTSPAKPKFASSAVVNGSEIFVPLEGLIDLGAERGRLEKEIARLQQAIESISRKLGTASFVERAPKEVVEREREKLTSFKMSVEKLQGNLSQLLE